MKMSYNGCGAIALYNALRLIGSKPDMGLIVTLIERYGLVLFGIFGTSPYRIRRIGSLLGAVTLPMKSFEEYEKAAEGNVSILCCWTGKPFRSTRHFTAIDGRGGRFVVYNRYNDLETPSEIDSIGELCDSRRFVSSYIIKAHQT